MSDQATSALSNISPGDQLWYWLAFLGIICLLGIAVGSLIDIRRWWRDRPRLRGLMDDGDGQGGVPPIARKLAQAEAQTQAMSMRAVAVTVREPVIPGDPDPCLTGDCDCAASCPWCNGSLSLVSAPSECKCHECRPCAKRWCARRRQPNVVPVEWEREGGWR